MVQELSTSAPADSAADGAGQNFNSGAPSPVVDSSPAASSGTIAPSSSSEGPSSFQVLSHLQSAGYDTSAFKTDQDAFNALMATAEEFHRTRPYVECGQYFSQHQDEFERWLQQQHQAGNNQQSQLPDRQGAQQPGQSGIPQSTGDATPAAATFEWKVPEYDPKWERYCDLDQNGRWRASDPALTAYAKKLNDYYDWHRDSGQRIVSEFPTLVEQVTAARFAELQKQFEQLLDQRFETFSQRLNANYQGQAFVQQNLSRMFQMDAQGQLLRDPATGQEAMTPWGQAFLKNLQELQQRFQGADPVALRDYAQKLADAEVPATQPAQQATTPPAPTPVETGTAKRGEFLRKVVQNSHAAGRGGSIPGTNERKVVQNPDATIHEIFDEEAARAGIRP